MLTIEEYIKKRKREDELDEFDNAKRPENTKTCVNYVFEYFNVYLGEGRALETTNREDKKVQHYKRQLKRYEPQVADWLIEIYKNSGKYLDKAVKKYAEEKCEVFLFTENAEFRAFSYDCYAKIIKGIPDIKNETESFYHAVIEVTNVYKEGRPFIKCDVSDEVKTWVEETYQQYGACLLTFSYVWLKRWFWDYAQWPTKSKIKAKYYGRGFGRDYKYNYLLDPSPFGINHLYKIIPAKPFLSGKKKYFEELLLGIWKSDFDGTDYLERE